MRRERSLERIKSREEKAETYIQENENIEIENVQVSESEKENSKETKYKIEKGEEKLNQNKGDTNSETWEGRKLKGNETIENKEDNKNNSIEKTIEDQKEAACVREKILSISLDASLTGKEIIEKVEKVITKVEKKKTKKAKEI
ncbi:uncharacterized protein [Centruroides vittatus]|uniref:uncharacterized protein n=1 Tax=Centruroides vittatus TaxID=120091 RepID=UPI00351061FB